ncbi:MAG: cobalamin-binding protein [Burkholderiales bacterium]|nr:cobalamin-binding protein [Burkholderiales bacterium]
MMRRWLSALVWSLAAAAAPAAITVRDDTGHTLTLPQPARRVVALGPHLAELVFAAGAGERLVGVLRYSDFPPEAAKLPLVGDAFAINLEAIAQLKPDLLLVWQSGINPRQRERLRTLGVPVYESESGDVAGIADTLRRVGTLLGRDAAAEAAARQMLTRWQALRERYAQRKPLRVFYQLWHEPLMTVNHLHLIHQAIRACGGINVFGDLPVLTPTVSWESVAAANPQVVVTSAARDEPARLEGWARLARVDAVRNGQLRVIDGHTIARMTPRFVDGAESLCQAMDRAR